MPFHVVACAAKHAGRHAIMERAPFVSSESLAGNTLFFSLCRFGTFLPGERHGLFSRIGNRARKAMALPAPDAVARHHVRHHVRHQASFSFLGRLAVCRHRLRAAGLADQECATLPVVGEFATPRRHGAGWRHAYHGLALADHALCRVGPGARRGSAFYPASPGHQPNGFARALCGGAQSF